MANEHEQKEWGQALAEGLAQYPALVPVALAGLSANPKPLIDLFTSPDHADAKAAFDAILQNAQEAITHLTLSNTAELDTRDQHLQNLQTENQNLTSEVQRLTIEGNLLKTMALNAPTRPNNTKRSTQDPPAFTGGAADIAKCQNDFLTWRTKVTGNLLVDADVFSTEFKKIHYLSTVLTGPAYEICRDNFEKITNNQHNSDAWPWNTAAEVIRDLTHRFVTLDLSRQAIIDLENLYMNNAPYANFKSKFDILAARADTTNVQKVRLLREKVSRELREISMNRGNQPAKDDFTAWSKRFQEIYEDKLDFNHQDEKNTSTKRTTTTYAQPTNTVLAQPATDHGDPMILDAFKGPKVSRDECAQKGLCFYCKKPGHNKADCNEKKKNDAKYGMPRPQIQGTAAPRYNPYNSREPQQARAPGHFPHAQRQYQQPYADRYSTFQGRRMDHGYIESEVQSSTSSPRLTPPSVSPSASTSNTHQNQSGNA
jgi:hypothetical protein